jgi:hypothetical protein
MKFDTETIKINLRDRVGKYLFKDTPEKERIEIRDDLIKSMGYGKKIDDISTFIKNDMGEWINPYLVAKYHSEKGIPKSVSIERIALKFEIDDIKKWWDGEIDDINWEKNKMNLGWCDFWFYSFIKIPHNILCDSKTYFEKMK